MPARTVHLRPRYYRRFTDPGVEMLEANTCHAELDWDVRLSEMALVCVDIWDSDIHADMQARDDRVTRERIAPVVSACRLNGLLVIHAPAWPTAERHPNWVGMVDHNQVAPARPGSPQWPPADFRKRTGAYSGYARPVEPRMEDCDQVATPPDFHELVRPVADEPVISVGEELHRFCAERGLLHLVYVGFHTPGCMTLRSYGMPQMLSRGYHCILLRDCTNGMETHQTHEEQTCLRGGIAFLEYMGLYTLTSEQFIAALNG